MPDLSLEEKQLLFAKLVGTLLDHIYASGYGATLGEAYRPQFVALYYLKKGLGIKNSNHTKRLAIDLNLFKDGKYLTATPDYEPIGIWWETQHPLARWGGRFKDGNHFSLEHLGVK